jgi:Family of unknown function (DUF6516)
MKAELIFRRRVPITEDSFVELVAWRVPHPLEGSSHNFKYRFAYVVNELCMLRYDNERGKGDHKHIGLVEHPYKFLSLDALIADFTEDVEGIER